MKVYTVEDFKTFERDCCGRLICPSGDYTQISNFGENCNFGDHCRFGGWCHFNTGCSFGEYCTFGEHCRFEEWCHFNRGCRFGEHCHFGGKCVFDEYCNFGEHCGFGRWCHFGEYCNFDKYGCFGEKCNLENNLMFENIEEPIDRVLKIDRIGSRKGCTYFFKTLSEIYVRCGCFFGTIAEFERQVNFTHKDNKQYRKEYLLAIEYVKAITLNE